MRLAPFQGRTIKHKSVYLVYLRSISCQLISYGLPTTILFRIRASGAKVLLFFDIHKKIAPKDDFCDAQRANNHELPLTYVLLTSYLPLIYLLPACGFDQLFFRSNDRNSTGTDGRETAIPSFASYIGIPCQLILHQRCFVVCE